MQFIKIVDNSRSWRVFSLCSNSSPFFLSFSVSIFVSKNRNEAAAACSQRSSPPWASASQAGPASAPCSQPAQLARQPARSAPSPSFSHPVASLPRSPYAHVALATPLASLWLQRTRPSPFHQARAGLTHGHGRVDAVLHPSPWPPF